MAYFFALIRLLRPLFWIKNILVFLPAIAAGQAAFIFGDDDRVLIYTFLSFLLLSSSGYIFNDLSDCESDRNHIKKKDRPIPGGHVNKQTASFMLAMLAIGGFWLSKEYLPREVLTWQAYYFGLGIAYSLFLKRIPYVGLVFVSGGVIFRIIAGAEAIEVPYKMWWLVVAYILSLAFNLIRSRHFSVA